MSALRSDLGKVLWSPTQVSGSACGCGNAHLPQVHNRPGSTCAHKHDLYASPCVCSRCRRHTLIPFIPPLRRRWRRFRTVGQCLRPLSVSTAASVHLMLCVWSPSATCSGFVLRVRGQRSFPLLGGGMTFDPAPLNLLQTRQIFVLAEHQASPLL